MTTAVASNLEAHVAQAHACLGSPATDDEIAAESAALPSMASEHPVATLGGHLRTFAAEHGDSDAVEQDWRAPFTPRGTHG